MRPIALVFSGQGQNAQCSHGQDGHDHQEILAFLLHVGLKMSWGF